MSIYINQLAITLFDSMPKLAYEAKGFKLRGAVRSLTNVIGRTVQFDIFGKGMARQKAPQDDVTPLNVNNTHVTAILEDWYAAEYSSIFERSDHNFNELQYLAEILAASIGRRADQQVINALAASATTNTIAAGATGFTYAKFLELNRFMRKNNVKDTGSTLHIAIDATAEEDLLNEDKFIRNNYSNEMVLQNGGSLDNLAMFGYTWHVFGDMDEGGIPVSGSTHSAYAWAANSIGHATGMEFATEVNYIPTKTSFLATAKYKAVAKAIDPVGIIQIDYV
jgi:hypothetical protein